MLRLSKIVGKKSAVNFRNQQKSLGELNGFIEEMMEGQKVKDIQSRRENQSEFEALNEELRKASTDAQTYAGNTYAHHGKSVLYSMQLLHV